MYQQQLSLAKEMGDRQITANALTNLGNVYAGQGRVTEAIGLHREALLIFEALGYQPSVAAIHFNLACVLHGESLADWWCGNGITHGFGEPEDAVGGGYQCGVGAA